MLALLSSPVRRWLLAVFLIPLLVWVLARAGTFLERRNGGETTVVSRLLLRSSSALERLTKGRREPRDQDALQAASSSKTA